MELALDSKCGNTIKLLTRVIKLSAPQSHSSSLASLDQSHDVQTDSANDGDVSMFFDPVKTLIAAICKGNETLVSLTISQVLKMDNFNINGLLFRWTNFLYTNLVDSTLSLSPLHIACCVLAPSTPKIIRCLTHNHADLNLEIDFSDCNPLNRDSSSELLSSFSRSKSSSCMSQGTSSSAIHLAFSRDNVKMPHDVAGISTKLLNCGGNHFIFDQAQQGETSLHLAIRHLNEPVIKLLLASGSKLSAIDHLFDFVYSFNPFLNRISISCVLFFRKLSTQRLC
ncbi:hypothetical protein GEMRC1_001535 [Eukaryota sp. GEM-RC1]